MAQPLLIYISTHDSRRPLAAHGAYNGKHTEYSMHGQVAVFHFQQCLSFTARQRSLCSDPLETSLRRGYWLDNRNPLHEHVRGCRIFNKTGRPEDAQYGLMANHMMQMKALTEVLSQCMVIAACSDWGLAANDSS